MKRIVGLMGMSLGGLLGWELGSLVSFFTGYLVAVIGSGLGLYMARRFVRAWLP